MDHTPHEPRPALLDQATNARMVAAWIAATLSDEQKAVLTRVFTSFQRNVVHEAPAASLPDTELKEPDNE